MRRIAVVRLVGQPDARLGQVQKVAGGILGVGVDVDAGASSDAGALQAAEHRSQRVAIGGRVHGGELVEQRRHTEPGDGGLVHEASVEIADALLIGARCRARFRSLGDQIADLLLGAVGEQAERAVGRAVGGNLVLGQPAAVDVAEEVVLRAGVCVDVVRSIPD